jgi:probable rRNA maturation factor
MSRRDTSESGQVEGSGGEGGNGYAVHVVIDREFRAKLHPELFRRAACAVLDQEGPFDEIELSLHVTGDMEIQELNRRYRAVDEPTDVLSFMAGSDTGATSLESDDFVLPAEVFDQLGEVVISYPRAVAQAKEHGHGLDRELSWLAVHGVLQLLGYTHDTAGDAHVMEAREDLALETLGYTIALRGTAKRLDGSRCTTDPDA